MKKKRVVIIVFLIASIIVLDQFTKWIMRSDFTYGESIIVIKGIFNITYVRNPGAAFGMLANSSELIRFILFKFLTAVAIIWLFVLVWQTIKKGVLLNIAYSLILAGAIGNIIDRVMFNYVVDFLDFHFYGSHFPAFNVADSSITVGGTLLVLDLIITYKNERREKQKGILENS